MIKFFLQLKKIETKTVLTVILTVLGGYGFSAQAAVDIEGCPQLVGNFNCEGRHGTTQLSIEQETLSDLGYVRYIFKDAAGSSVFLADDIAYPYESQPNRESGSIKCSCSESKLLVSLKGQILTGQGQVLKTWDLVQTFSLNNGDLDILTTGYSETDEGKKDISTPVKCKRLPTSR